MSSLDPGIRKLAKTIDKVLKLARVVKQLPTPTGYEVLKLAERGAAQNKSPGGRSWKPLKSGGKALASLTFSLHTNEGRVIIRGAVKAAAFHQKGARRFNWRLPSRSFLPKKSLPKAWRGAVVKVVKSEVSKCLK